MQWYESGLQYVLAILGVAMAALLVRGTIALYRKISTIRRRGRVSDQAKNSMRVKEELIELRIACKATRAYVCQFSNGIYYKNATSQLNWNCTHEALHAGVSSIAGQRRNLLLTQVPVFFNDLLKHTCKKYVTANLDDVPLKMMMREAGVETFIAAPFMNKGGELEGVVIVDYTLDTQEHWNKSLCPVLEDIAKTIGYTLRLG